MQMWWRLFKKIQNLYYSHVDKILHEKKRWPKPMWDASLKTLCVIETSYNVWRHCHNHKNSKWDASLKTLCVIETSYNVWRHCHNHKNSNCSRNINWLPLFLVWIQKKWNSCMSLVLYFKCSHNL